MSLNELIPKLFAWSNQELDERSVVQLGDVEYKRFGDDVEYKRFGELVVVDNL